MFVVFIHGAQRRGSWGWGFDVPESVCAIDEEAAEKSGYAVKLKQSYKVES